MIVIADTSALFAAFDAAQSEHQAAAALLEDESFVVSPMVLTELDRLVRRDLGYKAALEVLEASPIGSPMDATGSPTCPTPT